MITNVLMATETPAMEMQAETNPDAAKASLNVERLFDAPREMVFNAWASATHMIRWYAPHGCTLSIKSYDFRTGGSFHTGIHGPDGKGCWCVGTFREIEAPSRIVYTIAIADSEGHPMTAVQAGMDPEWPEETVVTVNLEACDGKPRLTLHQTVAESLARRTGALPSWLKMLDRLEGLLADGLVA